MDNLSVALLFLAMVIAMSVGSDAGYAFVVAVVLAVLAVAVYRLASHM